MNDEAGSLSAFLAVVALSLFVLAGLVVDGGRAIAAREAAWNTAQQAARVGAGQISVQGLRWNEVVTDPSTAQDAALSFLQANGYSGTVRVIDGTVTVSLATSEPTVILGVIGIHHIAIVESATAIDVNGVTRND